MSRSVRNDAGKRCAVTSVIAAIVLVLTGLPGPSAQAQTGTIRGTIRLPVLAQVAPRAKASRYRTAPAADQSRSEAAVDKPDVTNVVVYVEGSGLENLAKPSKPVLLDQRDAAFLPHVLPIVKGSSVRIVNRDKTYHNVFSLSNVKKFNIGRRPTGEEVPVDFDKSGVVQVFCDIHSNMSAFILVLDNPLFAQPNDAGVYELPGVPPGQYLVHAWHERMSAEPQRVTVRAGETLTVNFNF